MPPSTLAGAAIHCVSIVCPEFLDAYLREPQRLPSLERLIAYSSGAERSHSDDTVAEWQCEFLGAVGLPAAFPSAPITWLGATGERISGTCVHADPVFLTLSAQGMTLQPAPAWTSDQAAQVESLVSEHLQACGMTWRVAGTRTYLHVMPTIDVRTVCPRAAACSPLADVLPSGPDAVRLRQAMNEVQMLIHERLDAAAPNGIWLWGSGQLPQTSSRVLPMLWTNDDYARGVYMLHGAQDRVAPSEALAELMGRPDGESVVVVIRDQTLKDLEQRVFAPVLKALHAGQLRAVDLYLDGWRASARKSTWRRLFAKPRALQVALT